MVTSLKAIFVLSEILAYDARMKGILQDFYAISKPLNLYILPDIAYIYFWLKIIYKYANDSLLFNFPKFQCTWFRFFFHTPISRRMHILVYITGCFTSLQLKMIIISYLSNQIHLNPYWLATWGLHKYIVVISHQKFFPEWRHRFIWHGFRTLVGLSGNRLGEWQATIIYYIFVNHIYNWPKVPYVYRVQAPR